MFSINRLTIQNFRSIQSADLQLAQVNIFTGKLNQGKSSLLEAVKLLFQGYNSWTSKKGDGYKKLIRKGQKLAIVNADTSLGNVQKLLPGKFFFNGTDENAYENFLYKLNISKESLRALSDFVALDVKQQIALLLSINTVQENKPLLDYFAGELKISPKAKTTEEVMRQYLTSILPPGSENIAPAALLDIIEKTAREERRLSNKIIDSKTAILKETQILPDFLAPEQEEQVLTQIRAKRQERDHLLTLLGSIKAREEKQQRIEKLTAKIKDLNNLLSQAKVTDFSKLEADLKTVQEQLNNLIQETAAIVQEGKTVARFIDEFKKFNHKCKIDSTINCKLTEQEIEVIIKKYESRHKQLSILYKEKNIKKDELARFIQVYTKQLEETRETNYKTEQWTKELQQTRDEMAALITSMKAIPNHSEEELRGKEQELASQIEKLEEILQKARKQAEAKAKFANLKEDISLNQEAVYAYDFIIDAISAVKSKIGNGISSFIELLNKALSLLNMPEATFSIEDGLQIGGTDYNLLSDSEKLRVRYASQHVLCQLFHFPVFIGDNLDWITADKEAFSALKRFIQNIAPNYGTILLAGTGEIKTFASMGRVFEVKEGSISLSEQTV